LLYFIIEKMPDLFHHGDGIYKLRGMLSEFEQLLK